MSQTHTPTGGDSSQGDFGPGEYDPALWQPEPELESVGSWLSDLFRNPGRRISRTFKKIVREASDTVSDIVDGVVHIAREAVDTTLDVARGTANIVGGLIPGGIGAPPVVAPPNPPPVRQDGFGNDGHIFWIGDPTTYSYTLNEGTFVDPGGEPVTYSLAPGTVLPEGIGFNPATRTFSGTPTTPGSIVITVRGSDPGGRYDTDQIRLTVRQSNRPPEGPDPDNPPAFSKLVGEYFTINMNDYFSDPDGDGLRYTVDSLPAGVSLQENGTYIFGTPQVAFNGVFSITARDIVSNQTVTASFRLIVEQPNRVPVPGVPINDQAFLRGEDTNFMLPANMFSDPDGDDLELSQVGLPAGLSLVEENGRHFIRGAAADLTQEAIVTITADDGNGGTAVQIFTYNVVESLAPPPPPPQPGPPPEPPIFPPPQPGPPPEPPIFPPEPPIFPPELSVNPEPHMAPDRPVSGTSSGNSPIIHRAQDPGSETLTGTDGPDIFVLATPTIVEADVDIVLNFQQGPDKIHLPGITSVTAAQRDIDGDDTVDQTVLVGGTGAARGVFGVLADFTGMLTPDDFVASPFDPALVGSVTEVITVAPEIA